MHPFSIPRDLEERILARRGRLHAYESIDPARTALLVIDMQRTFLDPSAPSEVPMARDIVPNINRLSEVMRDAGCFVAFSLATFPDEPAGGWPTFFDHVVAPEISRAILEGLRTEAPGRKLWPALTIKDGDHMFEKRRYSAFARGASDIEAELIARDIDTLIITGTMTNLCCESTGRDAMQIGYKTILVSDATAARTDAEHQTALWTFLTSFGDVRTTNEVIELVKGQVGSAAAE